MENGKWKIMVEKTDLFEQNTFMPDRIQNPPQAEYKFGRENEFNHL